jgi:cytochrome c oxidase subunit I+III
MRDVDEGRFYLPDAEEGKRETLVTTTIDARPIQCLRVPGPTFLTLYAALFTGGVFIFLTYHWWWAALASGLLALGSILAWMWTGTATIPEKRTKPVGLGLTLPLYASGPDSVGWWAMFITMIGDMTAYVSLIFSYFFFWTVRNDFPDPNAGPGVVWPITAAALVAGAWGMMRIGERWNRDAQPRRFRAALAAAVILALAGAAALLAGPWATGLEPTRHVYPAMVWVLVLWTAFHVLIGVIMQLYCVARSIAGRLTAEHDIDIHNVVLYWHFALVTVFGTVLVIAGVPGIL